MCSLAPLRSIVPRESIPRFRDTRVPTAASSLRSPTILTFNQSSRLKFKISRYLLSNEFSFLEFWTRMIIPFTTGNYEENFYTHYSFFTRWLKSQSARKFIYLHPSLVIFSTNYIIEVYLRDDIRTISGEGISGWKIYTRGESKSLWLEMNDGSPATLATGMVAKAVHGRRIPSCRTIPKEV